MYIYVYMCVYIYIYIYIYTSKGTHTPTHPHTHTPIEDRRSKIEYDGRAWCCNIGISEFPTKESIALSSYALTLLSLLLSSIVVVLLYHYHYHYYHYYHHYYYYYYYCLFSSEGRAARPRCGRASSAPAPWNDQLSCADDANSS